jgi:hypothetical protein
MDSIRSYVTPETICATVLMVKRGQAKERPVLLVEGDKDRRVIHHCLGSIVDVVPGDGKPVLLGAIEHIRNQDPELEKWLIVVIDADFDRILQKTYSPFVLLTDAHDVDCEYIRSPALNKVIGELCSDQRCEKHFGQKPSAELASVTDAIRSLLLTKAKILGTLRLLSIKLDFRLSFKQLDHTKIVPKTSFDIDRDVLIRVLMAAGASEGVTPELIRTKLEEALEANNNDWQICQGHDLIKLFAIGVRKFWGKADVTIEEAERGLRLAYERSFFWDTALGKTLRERLQQLGCSGAI